MGGMQLLESVSLLSSPTSETVGLLCYWQGRSALLKQTRRFPVSDGLWDDTLESGSSVLLSVDCNGITWDLVRDAGSQAHAHLLHRSLIFYKIPR